MYFIKYLFSLVNLGVDDIIDDITSDYSPHGPAEYGPIKFIWLNLLVLAADIFIFTRFISGAPRIWWWVGTFLVADLVTAAVNLLRREVTSAETDYFTNETRVVIKEVPVLICSGCVIQVVIPVVYFFTVLIIR